MGWDNKLACLFLGILGLEIGYFGGRLHEKHVLIERYQNRKVINKSTFQPAFHNYHGTAGRVMIDSERYFEKRFEKHPADADNESLVDKIKGADEKLIHSIRDRIILPKVKVRKRRNGRKVKPYYDKNDMAQKILDFVHMLPYTYDVDHYGKYPTETLAENGGDCEDLSILYATLARSCGLDVVLAKFKVPNTPKLCHVLPAVNLQSGGRYTVHNGKRYYYAETTGTRWVNKPANHKIGHLNKDYQKLTPEIIEVK